VRNVSAVAPFAAPVNVPAPLPCADDIAENFAAISGSEADSLVQEARAAASCG